MPIHADWSHRMQRLAQLSVQFFEISITHTDLLESSVSLLWIGLASSPRISHRSTPGQITPRWRFVSTPPYDEGGEDRVIHSGYELCLWISSRAV